MNKKIIIIGGDPNSINSEIICKVWRKISSKTRDKIYLITNYNMFKAQKDKLNFKIKLEKVENISKKLKLNNLKILDINLKFKNPFKVPNKESANFVIESLNLAHKLALNKEIKGIINCPIKKILLKKTKKIGVTEFLASKNNVEKDSEVMLIYNKKFSVSPLTTHINIDKITKRIKKDLLVKKIKTINKSFKKLFNKNPKICVLGLNPHNSEYSKSSKELKIIKPTILSLKRDGLKVFGPYSADTVFIKDYKFFDMILGMYHDQVLGPFKSIFKFDAINITLGLQYIRVSPDHGTATNLIKKNKASPLSLLRCVEFLNKIN